MPLGKQFNNTYWFTGRSVPRPVDDKAVDEVGFSLTKPKDPHSPVITRPNDGETADSLGFMSDEFGLGSVQGLLFHPATGTGLSDDPLIPIEQRRSAVDRVLGFDQRKPAPRSKKDEELLRDSLVSSTLPTPALEAMRPTRAFLRAKKRGGGSYNESEDRLMVGRQNAVRKERVPEKVVSATTASDEPIFNEKFSDQFLMKINATENFSSDVSKHADEIVWRNPETGEVISGNEAVYRGSDKTYGPRLRVRTAKKDPPVRYVDKFEDYDLEKHGPLSELSRDPADDVYVEDEGGDTDSQYWVSKLSKQGFQPNLFFGKGVSPENRKIHSNPPFRAERDYRSPYTMEWPTLDVHTRFVPGDETVDTVIPGRTVTHRTPYIDQSTLVHELGHHTDRAPRSDIGQIVETTTRHVDPLGEGRADGLADHYATLQRHGGAAERGRGDQLEGALSDPALVQADLAGTGYTTGNKHWKNNLMRALYAATRLDARLNGLDAQHPSRQRVLDSLGALGTNPERIDRLTLGHLWEHMPHIRPHMPGDLRAEAESAHLDYLKAANTHSLNQHNEWVLSSNNARRKANMDKPTSEQFRMLEEISHEPPEQMGLPGFENR